MYYPWLDVPFLTAPALFEAFNLLFTCIVYYAVGGGLLLALENGWSLRAEDTKYRAYLKKRAGFLASTTIPLGTTAGVGALFAFGLATPLSAQTLVRHFVFVFAIEWCLWLLALVSAFALYYCWDKLRPVSSRVVAWCYATSVWLALVLLTAISSFALNSVGVVEDYESTGVLWHALVNVQLLPQTIARSGGALLLGAVFFLVHASHGEKDLNIRERVAKRMRVPAFAGILLLLAGVVGWGFFLPETGRLTLERLASTSSCAWFFCAVLATIFVLLLVGPCSKPRELNLGQTLSLLFLTFACVVFFEDVRKDVGKPYSIDRIVYANQIYRDDIQETRQIGLLYKGIWTSYALDALQEDYPDLPISAANYLGIPTIHFEPPTIPEPEEGEEEEVESEEEEVIEGEGEGIADPEGDALGVDVNLEYFALTVAQRQLTEQNNFVPISSSAGANTRANLSPALTPNQSPTLQGRLGASPSLSEEGGAQNPTLQNPAQGRDARELNVDNAQNIGARQNAPSPPRRLQPSQGNALPASPAVDAIQPERNATRPRASAGITTPDVQPQAQALAPAQVQSQASSLSQPQAPTQSAPRRSLDAGATSDNNRQSVTSPLTSPVPEEENAALSSPLAPSSPSDETSPVMKNSDEEEEESLTRATPEELDLNVNGAIARGNEALLKITRRDQIALGRMVFMRHCNSCHASEHGLLAVGPLVVGLSRKEIKNFALRLNYSHVNMPPWAGTDVEAELLAEYLDSIAPNTPNNAFMKDKPKKELKPEKPKKSKKKENDSQSKESIEDEPSEELPAVPAEDSSTSSL